jgi:hypothetical protein
MFAAIERDQLTTTTPIVSQILHIALCGDESRVLMLEQDLRTIFHRFGDDVEQAAAALAEEVLQKENGELTPDF